MLTKIPLFIPWILSTEKKIMLRSLRSNQLTDGPNLRKFENQFASFVKSKFAKGVSNGTSALHLALTSLGIGKDDEVIIPDLTFVATSNAVLHCNARPIPVDIDESLNISPKAIKEKISNKTKAIIPVHLAGNVCKMKEIKKIAKKNNLRIIEDCAHSLGAMINHSHVGTIGDAGCFSFYPTKNITTIEGGMVVTNSSTIEKKISRLRSHGLTTSLTDRHMGKKPWIYDMPEFGYNYRLDEIRSSLGISQLKRIKNIAQRRISAAEYYNKKLKHINGLEIPPDYTSSDHVYHLYIVKIKKEFGVSRDKIHLQLIKKGIYTTVHYRPIHQFSYFKNRKFKNKDFPNTMKAYRQCLTLPLFPTITRKQQDSVISQILGLKK